MCAATGHIPLPSAPYLSSFPFRRGNKGPVKRSRGAGHWQIVSPEEYQSKKKDTAQLLIGRLDKVIPGISDAVDYFEVGTPKTILVIKKNTYGNIYGFAQTIEHVELKRITAKSPVGGLYFASAWAFPGGGFSGAMIGGYLEALQALNDGF